MTIDKIMSGTLFGEPPGALKSKQSKPDSTEGWTTVAQFAGAGVPYSHLLHQRHYGGSFRQVLDATSTPRGELIEDAVEDLFRSNGIPYVRTSYSQADIESRFEVTVHPAPDFVVFDSADTLREMWNVRVLTMEARLVTRRRGSDHCERSRCASVGFRSWPYSGGSGGQVNDTLGPVIRACVDASSRSPTLTRC